MSAAEDFSTWPTTLREVAEVIGRDAALRLAQECGGVLIYVPTEVHPEHPWCIAVGEEAFAKLAHAFGGQRIDLPRGSFIRLAKAQILEMAAQGMSTRAIAMKLHVTQRHVRRVLEGMTIVANDPKQMKLF